MSGPQIGDLKIWYTHQIPGKAYEQPVPDIATGFVILQAIYKVALFGFDNRWWPDYANAGGIVRYEDVGDGEIGWFDVDADEIAEVLGVDLDEARL